MDDRTERQIARIDEISALARTSWIALLAYLAFIFVTLLGVEDADFFVPSRQTQLPLVNVSIPTKSFFIFAPLMASALYVYLQIFLIKLWDAIAAAPAQVRIHDERPEWIPLGDAIHPWLANDLACGSKGNGARPVRPLRRLGSFTTMLLIWLAGPAVVFAFWIKSTGAHNEWLTLGISVFLWFAVFAMISSMLWSVVRLKNQPLKTWHLIVFVTSFAVFTWTLVSESWLRTEGGLEHYAKSVLPMWYGAEEYQRRFRTCNPGTERDCLDRFGEPWPEDMLEERRIAELPWLPKTDPDYLMPMDLFEAQMVPLPESWRDYDIARMEFREQWCRREGLKMEICDHRPDRDRTPPPHVATARAVYCTEHSVKGCKAQFSALDASFDADWATERETLRDALPVLDLAEKDLRQAVFARASLVNARLSGARMERANLFAARLEGADLTWARLEGANLTVARLEGANLFAARLEWADLTEARMEGANLTEARMEGAYLFAARMEGADLTEARMEGAYLFAARMEGVNLFAARMQGADLTWADLRSAIWAGARVGSLAHFADLRGAQGLTQHQLDQMIGNAMTLLPEVLEGGAEPTIPSCWDREEPPGFFDEMIKRMGARWYEDRSEETIRDEYLCPPGEKPRPTGKRLSLDEPRSKGHPPGNADG